VPYVIGICAVLVLWLLVGLASTFRPSEIILGQDGHASTSKLQLVLWTAVVVFAYAAIETLRFRLHVFGQMAAIPTNLMIAMGISGVTAVSAQAIRVNAENTGPQAVVAVSDTTSPAPSDPSPSSSQTTSVVASVPLPSLRADASGILQGTDGKPDLGKLQIVVWTGIALAVFLGRVFHAIHTQGLDLPDIDQTQMVLMGIGHGTYLGKKIAES